MNPDDLLLLLERLSLECDDLDDDIVVLQDPADALWPILYSCCKTSYTGYAH